MTALIEVENLTLKFKTDEGLITAVDNVSFALDKGEVMGLVGESGSGKSRDRQIADAPECPECGLYPRKPDNPAH